MAFFFFLITPDKPLVRKIYFPILFQRYEKGINVTLSAKTSLMLGVHKAGFRREGHKFL